MSDVHQGHGHEHHQRVVLAGHESHESLHVWLALFVIVAMVASQYALNYWRAKHEASYVRVSLLLVWLLPAILSLREPFVRFLVMYDALAALRASDRASHRDGAHRRRLTARLSLQLESVDPLDRLHHLPRHATTAAPLDAKVWSAARACGSRPALINASVPVCVRVGRFVYRWFLLCYKLSYTLAVIGFVMLVIGMAAQPVLWVWQWLVIVMVARSLELSHRLSACDTPTMDS